MDSKLFKEKTNLNNTRKGSNRGSYSLNKWFHPIAISWEVVVDNEK